MSGQNQTPERVSSESSQKTCADCGTTSPPLSHLLCACGDKSRKKRALMGLNKKTKSKKPSNKSIGNNHHHHHQNQSSNSSSTSSSGESTTSNAVVKKNECIPFKKRLLHFGREVGLQKPRSNSTHRRKLGEEEQAAFLLMALSCGSVYA
ncbi:hypothetical protein HAX54_052336 [Datura stramonium]|uniref:Uncharacterized protein n=1 Tax=Datura stramonium TaxID=4076 RepID=A0ABS8T0P5_DATST|nr:hypothetical protein [Datura stramonium]